MAKQIGMKTIWVRQGFAKYKSVKNDDEKADYTVEEIKDILKILS
jgi:FMN phosphatase YigB (HAD superfamily)